VAEIKRAIGAAREVPYFAMELFIKDQEKALDDELRMGPLNRPPLFMLVKVSSERLALVALFKSTGGASDWNDTEGWEELEEDEEADLDGAFGVQDLDAEGRVTKLLLNETGLAGPLPGIEILQLSALQELNLSGNRLTGVIPAELGQLRALVELSLNDNQLSGSIPPELGQLGALALLHLQGNQLSGSIPAELGQLEVLTDLRLHDNQLSGSIPAELGQLGALTVLGLHDNQLSGSIPDAELGQLGALTHVFLQNNQLSGKEAFRSHMEEHHAGCNVAL
jgi:Leucine-rich repeat (LRR) protein